MKKLRALCICVAVLAVLLVGEAYSGVYVFSDLVGNAELITHPPGFDGSANEVVVSVCIDPSSEAREELVVPVENAVRTWNGLEATTGNRILGNDNDVPNDQIDVESVLLHEIGHCFGLDHPNLDNNSGVPHNQRRHTNSEPGANAALDLDAGADGVPGSSLDERGDDVNRHWFAMAHNDPFVVEEVVDESTYSVVLSDLPADHLFAANANPSVGHLLGYPDSESVMKQGMAVGGTTRELAGDDVAMVRLASAGLDRTEGTPDDYEMVVEFVGETDQCDIPVKMGGNTFAYCTSGGTSVDGSDHYAVTAAGVYLGSQSQFNWYFNDESNEGDCPPDAIFCDDFED